MARAGKAKRRGRLVVLTVLGAIVATIVAYRQQQLGKHRAEFEESYG